MARNFLHLEEGQSEDQGIISSRIDYDDWDNEFMTAWIEVSASRQWLVKPHGGSRSIHRLMRENLERFLGKIGGGSGRVYSPFKYKDWNDRKISATVKSDNMTFLIEYRDSNGKIHHSDSKWIEYRNRGTKKKARLTNNP